MPSRSAARTLALTKGDRTYQGRPCKRGHSGLRLVSNRCCVECYPAIKARHLIRNRAAVLAAQRAAGAERRKQHPLAAKAWRERNREHLRQQAKDYAAAHRADRAASENSRRVAQMQRTAGWCDRAIVRDYYRRAEQTTAATGVKHSVDHILPLQGRSVCGLHDGSNLAVLPLSTNSAKGNRFEEQMLHDHLVGALVAAFGPASLSDDLIEIDPAAIDDPWLRDALIELANKRWGKRHAHGGNGGKAD